MLASMQFSVFSPNPQSRFKQAVSSPSHLRLSSANVLQRQIGAKQRRYGHVRALALPVVEPPRLIEELNNGTSMLGFQLFDGIQYRLGDQIGAGRYGIVHEAIQQKSGSKCAVKKIAKSIPNKKPESVLARIANEVQWLTLMQVNSSSVKLYDVQEDSEYVYIVMEHLPGGDLHNVAQKHGLMKESTAAVMIAQMLRAIRSCHNKGVAHRDIKPANFVFKQQPQIDDIGYIQGPCQLKLIDYGTCVECFERKKINWVAGTVLYLAPEVVLGFLEQNSDIWPVGLMLYGMLSGCFPFWDTYQEALDQPRKEVAAAIINQKIDFNKHEGVANASPLARDFLQGLLDELPTRRLSAQQALEHPWVQQYVPDAAAVEPSETPQFMGASAFPTFTENCTSEFHADGMTGCVSEDS